MFRDFWETNPDPTWALAILHEHTHYICEEMDKDELTTAINFTDDKWCA